jgi:hypothetical protein
LIYPNVYYCSVCWDEYENGSSLDEGFVESADSNEDNERNSGSQETKDNMEGSKDMKWKDKADLLIKLGKAVSKSDGRSWCEGALN